MSNKNIETQEKGLESIQSTLTKSEQFIEKNQKYLTYALAAILVVIGLYWAFVRFYKQPREKEANSQMFVAQQSFELDSFALALNGNMNYPGFITISEDYSGTKAGNLAKFYAGICYIHLGEYDNAIEILKKFKTSDIYYATEKFGLIGDAYVQKDDYDNAVSYFLKAVNEDYSNNFTTPIYLKKLGLVYEKQGKNKEALEVYEKIYKDYPKSTEARTIEKYIERVKLLVK